MNEKIALFATLLNIHKHLAYKTNNNMDNEQLVVSFQAALDRVEYVYREERDIQLTITVASAREVLKSISNQMTQLQKDILRQTMHQLLLDTSSLNTQDLDVEFDYTDDLKKTLITMCSMGLTGGM